MIAQNHPPLPRGTIGFALGIAGMLVSLYYSIMFISGTAAGVEIVIGVIFALTLDYGKVALASEAILALSQFRLLSAVMYSLIVICLYGLSMLAATFMLTTHSSNALVEQTEHKITTISQQITAKRAEIAACNPMALTKCVNPRTAELTALQTELANAQNVSAEVLEAKNTAATWEKMATALGATVDELQVKLAFTRAILLEIIAPILVSIFLTAYRKRLAQNQLDTPQERFVFPPSEPQQLTKQPMMDMAKLTKK